MLRLDTAECLRGYSFFSRQAPRLSWKPAAAIWCTLAATASSAAAAAAAVRVTSVYLQWFHDRWLSSSVRVATVRVATDQVNVH